MKKTLITGITGQDGSYLTEFLLEKGYEVHGIIRRCSSFHTPRIDHLLNDPKWNNSLFLHYGDLTDSSNLTRLIGEIGPDEIYNLGAQSHVQVSFESPEYTADVDALGVLRILEAIRILNLTSKTRFYQASTSELFGLVRESPQTELTPFYPRSPYACAKLYSYWITVNYREAYGLYACNGILFNHESPRRGETFVTRKITRGVARTILGLDRGLKLGNLDSLRDWGHARDYVRMQWMLLQQPEPDDYVIATGKQASVRDFLRLTARNAGLELEFIDSGRDEKAYISAVDTQYIRDNFHIDESAIKIKAGDLIAQVDPRYFRPSEVATLLGDASKARAKLGWQPEISLEEMAEEMLAEDMRLARKEALIHKLN